MTLAAFHASVSRALKRGSSVDAIIPDWTKAAALWLEQNYSFGYMSMVLEATLDPDAVTPNLVEIEDRIKAVEFVQLVNRDNPSLYSHPLQKVDAGQVVSIDEGDPRYYWLDGADRLWLDAKVKSPLTIRVGGIFYTDWPEDTGATPTLLRYYENLLRAQTLIEAAVELKDDRMLAAYNGMFERAIAAVLVAEEERKRLGTETVMRYAGSR